MTAEQVTETKMAGLEELVTASTAFEVPGQPHLLDAPARVKALADCMVGLALLDPPYN